MTNLPPPSPYIQVRYSTVLAARAGDELALAHLAKLSFIIMWLNDSPKRSMDSMSPADHVIAFVYTADNNPPTMPGWIDILLQRMHKATVHKTPFSTNDVISFTHDYVFFDWISNRNVTNQQIDNFAITLLYELEKVGLIQRHVCGDLTTWTTT